MSETLDPGNENGRVIESCKEHVSKSEVMDQGHETSETRCRPWMVVCRTLKAAAIGMRTRRVRGERGRARGRSDEGEGDRRRGVLLVKKRREMSSQAGKPASMGVCMQLSGHPLELQLPHAGLVLTSAK